MDFIGELYKTKYNLYFRYTLPLVNMNDDDAKDVINDVFLNAMIYFKNNEIIPDKINSFIFTSIHNRIKDNIKKRDALNFKSGFDVDKKCRQHYNIDREIINKIISNIRGYDFFMKSVNGYSYSEIAKHYNKKLSYVKVIIHNFRKKAMSIL